MADPETLRDEILEIEIQLYGKRAELADALLTAADSEFFLMCGSRDYWRLQMEAAIKARSPAQVKRMEQARGLS